MGQGHLLQRAPFMTTVVVNTLKFSFSDKYKSQSETTKAIFGQPDSKIPGLFDTVTGTSLSKQEDGSYAARLTGAIVRIKPRPLAGRRSSRADSGSSSARQRASRAVSSRRAARTGNADSEDEEPAEEDTENVE